jgi:uroporphyrinogen decarboxylase
MPEMTKRERLVCALSREEPDTVPIYDLVDHRGIIARFAGEELTLANAHEVVPLALSKVLDTTRVWLPEAPGRRVNECGFVYERGEWFNEWMVEPPFQDRFGLLKFIKSDIEQLEAWLPDPSVDPLAESRMWQEKFGDTVLPATMVTEALTDCAILIGIEQFVYLEADEPDLVRQWIDAHHQKTLRRLQSEADCAIISPISWTFADCAYKDHLMFSKSFLKSYGFFQHLAETMGILHSFGLKNIFHSDGNIKPIIPELIQAGADALAPIDTGAGLDLAKLKAEFGHKIAFVGGIDLGMISAGSPGDVRNATLCALKEAGPGGGFILGSSSEELYETLPEENILTMWNTAHEFGQYPIRIPETIY